MIYKTYVGKNSFFFILKRVRQVLKIIRTLYFYLANMKKIIFVLMLVLIFAVNGVIAENYTLEFNQIGDKVVIKEVFPNNETDFYLDNEIIIGTGEYLSFLKKISFSSNYSQVKIKINLDEGIVVNEEKIFPKGYYFESDGQMISINWELKNVKKEDTFAIFVELKDLTKSPVYFILGIILLGITLFFLLFLLMKKKFNRKQFPEIKKEGKNEELISEKENDEKYDYLLDTEKKVIEELKKAERNELWQKQIQNLTGFSKAKVSRLVRNLESRGLVKKIIFGNTNKIRLK